MLRLRHCSALAVAAAVVAGAAMPASASSLLGADIKRSTLGLGLGNGISAAIDFPVAKQATLGASANFGGWGWGGLGANFDVRGQYRLLERIESLPLTLSLMGGVAGYTAGVSGFGVFGVAPFVGVGLSYPFIPNKLIGRANVLVGFGFGTFGATYYAPNGAEIAYKFTPSLEGTLGWNSHGDILGLKYAF